MVVSKEMKCDKCGRRLQKSGLCKHCTFKLLDYNKGGYITTDWLIQKVIFYSGVAVFFTCLIIILIWWLL